MRKIHICLGNSQTTGLIFFGHILLRHFTSTSASSIYWPTEVVQMSLLNDMLCLSGPSLLISSWHFTVELVMCPLWLGWPGKIQLQYIAVLRVHNPETAMWSERDISPDMYHACITACITLAWFVAVVVCWDITDKWHSVMLSPYFLSKIGLELLNGIIYNGALCLTSNSNRNQLINYIWKQEIIGLTI